MEIVAVPTDLLDEIERRLDEQMPDEATDEDREALQAQLLGYVNEHGRIPDFTVERRDD